MDLNNIELPASVIADLYRSSLVDFGKQAGPLQEKHVLKASPSASADNTPGAPYKSLGENQKNILIVVEYSSAKHLPDDELNFLTTMLSACQLSLADVAIINRNNHKESDYKDLTSYFKSRIIFLFGIEPASFNMPINFPHFQIQSFASNTFLFTPSLAEIKKDKLLKSKLWVCLKRIFDV